MDNIRNTYTHMYMYIEQVFTECTTVLGTVVSQINWKRPSQTYSSVNTGLALTLEFRGDKDHLYS